MRPQLGTEHLEPAREAIPDLFMEHVLARAPGYERLARWVAAPVLPPPPLRV